MSTPGVGGAARNHKPGTTALRSRGGVDNKGNDGCFATGPGTRSPRAGCQENGLWMALPGSLPRTRMSIPTSRHARARRGCAKRGCAKAAPNNPQGIRVWSKLGRSALVVTGSREHHDWMVPPGFLARFRQLTLAQHSGRPARTAAKAVPRLTAPPRPSRVPGSATS